MSILPGRINGLFPFPLDVAFASYTSERAALNRPESRGVMNGQKDIRRQSLAPKNTFRS